MRLIFSLILVCVVTFASHLNLALGNSTKPTGKDKELTKALSRTTKLVDKMEGVTWLYSKATNSISAHDAIRRYADAKGWAVDVLTPTGRTLALMKYSTLIYPYIGKKADSSFLRFKVIYLGADWLFVDRYKVLADGKTFEFSGSESQIQRKADVPAVSETLDLPGDQKNIEMLETISKSHEATIRFYGKNGTADHDISKSEKKALVEMLSLYQLLQQHN